MKRSFDSSFVLRTTFVLGVVVISVASTLFSNKLAKDLASEERKKVELWAEAIRLFAAETNENVQMDYTLNTKVIEGNTNIPVVMADENGVVLWHKNLGLKDENDSTELAEASRKVIAHNQFIEVKFSDNVSHFVYYEDSTLLKKLTYFPFIQLMVMFVFVLVIIFALNSSKRAEQNRVWVGLSKETAHQLGTPISSLLAWVELLKLKDVDPKLLGEMEKDTKRLQTIAERFSKIGSKSETSLQDIRPVLENAVQYMRNRSSKKVVLETHLPEGSLPVLLNAPLFEWVVENLCKNAIDAMDGHGRIDIALSSDAKNWVIDFSDTGKGITKSNFSNVFKPGFTTKARGWGLGLSLVKRIIEENHGGKIFVKTSELGRGTTFRILLNKL
jgi:two-component system, sporulation sensor kinase D